MIPNLPAPPEGHFMNCKVIVLWKMLQLKIIHSLFSLGVLDDGFGVITLYPFITLSSKGFFEGVFHDTYTSTHKHTQQAQTLTVCTLF